MSKINEQIDRLNAELAQNLSVTEAALLAKELGLTPLNLFLGLVAVDRVSDAVDYAERTRYESTLPLARKIRAGTFVRDGKTYHLPKEVEPEQKPRKSDIAIFIEMVNMSQFAEAIVFGRKSEDAKARQSAESLVSGTFTRKRDGFRVPPSSGATQNNFISFFWYHYASKGEDVAYEWLKGVDELFWFKKLWDEGRLKHPDGSFLAPIATFEAPRDGVSSLARARQKKRERSERDRNAHYERTGTSPPQKKRGKKR